MTKVNLCSNSVTKEVVELEKNSEKELSENGPKRNRVRQCTFIFCLGLASYVCYLSAMRYFNWMAQTVIDRTDVHISEIPFPAVTLCPMMNVLELYKNDDMYIKQFLRSLEEVAPRSNTSIDFNYEGIAALDLIDEQILDNITFECEDIFKECTWRRMKRNCCTMFRNMPYGGNMCYSFNSLMVDDPDPTWPWVETLSGRKSGLRVIMNTRPTALMSSKVMAMVHYPEEHVSTTTLILRGHTRIQVDALKFYADPEIRGLHPEYRHCYFTDEITKYRKSNRQCLRECRLSYIEAMCKCTPKSLPRKTTTTTTKTVVYCNSTHLQCIFEHRDGVFAYGKFFKTRIDNESTDYLNCNCFPNCNYIQYRTFLSYDSKPECTNEEEEHIYVDLEVYYLRDTIFSYRTAMVYSLLDLMVALSSIIALFLGVSFISVIKAIQDHFARRKKARALAKAQQKK